MSASIPARWTDSRTVPLMLKGEPVPAWLLPTGPYPLPGDSAGQPRWTLTRHGPSWLQTTVTLDRQESPNR